MNLVPTYDLLGSPAPFWIVQLLMALTLALHWAFLAATVGGTAAVATLPTAQSRRTYTLLPFRIRTADTSCCRRIKSLRP